MAQFIKTTVVLMLVTIMSKILGFGREMALTYIHGATALTDAYIIAIGIPTVLFSGIGTALATTFIPIFNEIDKDKGRKDAIKFTNNIFNILLVLTILLSIVGFIFAEPLIKLFAMDFSGYKLKLAVDLVKIMIYGIIFIALSNLMTSWLQINGNFTISGMVGFPYNILIIISILLSSNGDFKVMAIGTLLGFASQLIIQFPYAYKTGYRYKMYINIRDKYVKKMLILLVPVFIGIVVNQVNGIIDRSLASTLGDGVITILNSANRLNGFVLGIFISTIVAVVYPMLSNLSRDGDISKFSNIVSNSINIINILIIPISIGAMVLAEPVVRIVFQRGAFDEQATHMTSIALICYSIGMIGFSIREILNRIFYSLQDTRTPMINGVITVLMNIILNLIMIRNMGYIGLALATSISSIICAIALFINLNRKTSILNLNRIAKTLAKSIIAAFIMGLATHNIYILFSQIIGYGTIRELLVLLSSVVIGAIIYLALMIIFRIEEVNLIVNKIKFKLFK